MSSRAHGPSRGENELAHLLDEAPLLPRLAARGLRPIVVLLWRTAKWKRRPWVVSLAFFVGLPAFIVMAQLQALLAAMHLPGETSYDLGDLAFPDRADAAIQTWLAHSSETTAKFSGPVDLTYAFVGVDMLLVLAYAAVLGVAAAAAYERLRAAGNDDTLLPIHRKLAAAAFASVPLLAVVDVLENVDTAVIVGKKGTAPKPLEWALTALWGAKWVLVIGITLPLVLAGVAIARRSALAGRDILRTLIVLRVQIVIVLFFALFLFSPFSAGQVDDVIRRWIRPDWDEFVVTSLLTLLLGAAIAVLSWRLLWCQSVPSRKLPVKVLGLVGSALIVAWLVFRAADLGGRGLFALGLILGAIALLSVPILDIELKERTQAKQDGWVVTPALLAALPTVLLGLATVRASVFELAYAGNAEYVALGIGGLALQALGWGTYLFAYSRGETLNRDRSKPATSSPQVPGTDDRPPGPGWLPALAAIVAALVGLGIWLDPWRTGGFVGTVGALAAFLLVVLLLGYLAVRFERRRLAPPFFLVFGLRGFPVFVIVIAWAIVAAMLDPGGYHDVRTIARTGGGPISLEQSWARWLNRQPEREAVPLVLVAAEGGGIRAAYWTARALDCTIDADLESCGYTPEGDPGDAGAVFAASGISGSSLGLVNYAAAVGQGAEGDWPQDRLGKDFLAATVAWMLFADLPNALLKFDFKPDRAAVLEEAWERAWGRSSPLETGLLATSANDEAPLLLLSGTSVQDGCRVNNSALNGDVEEPITPDALRARDCLSMAAFAAGSAASPRSASLAATHDLVDLLCPDEDVRLSTAALLSARFPWVSPAGRMPRCPTPEFATYVVDGGYFDTSAASPLQELWARLEPLVAEHNRSGQQPCVVPVFLQLDNHYKEPRDARATGRPWESGVPIQTVRAARDARENGARQATALLFSSESVAGVTPQVGDEPLVRYAHLFPRAHPGTSAPLGWALSQASMDDLTNQLREPKNANEFGKIRRWFSRDLTC